MFILSHFFEEADVSAVGTDCKDMFMVVAHYPTIKVDFGAGHGGVR